MGALNIRVVRDLCNPQPWCALPHFQVHTATSQGRMRALLALPLVCACSST